LPQWRIERSQVFVQSLLAEWRRQSFESVRERLQITLDLVETMLVSCAFRPRADLNHPLIRLEPVIGIEGGPKNGLQAVIFLLSNGLELVIVATGALKR